MTSDPARAARNEPPVRLRRLVPESALLTADELVQALELAAGAPVDRPYVVVNMVATVDGRATLAGRTAPISSVADRQLFHALRTRVDAVMVGAGTLRVERYGRVVRDARRREQRRAIGLEADPLAVVVSASLDLPSDLPLLQDPDSRVVVVTASGAALPPSPASVEYVRGDPVDLSAALARLREDHDVRTILCEGGPRLNASLLACGLIDELFLTTFPQLAAGGGELTIVGEDPGGRAPMPQQLELLWLLEHEGELFARYALSRSS